MAIIWEVGLELNVLFQCFNHSAYGPIKWQKKGDERKDSYVTNFYIFSTYAAF